MPSKTDIKIKQKQHETIDLRKKEKKREIFIKKQKLDKRANLNEEKMDQEQQSHYRIRI